MKFIQKKHRGLPLKCDCCEKTIHHQDSYIILIYNELEVSLTNRCCDNFIKKFSYLINED